MSNQLAAAVVTATIKYVLQRALDADLPGARVTSVRPNAPASDLPDPSGVNVYLFQATPNIAGRNADTPTRRGDGTLVRKPQAAIDLHFLLSFYGDDKIYEPQIVLASTVLALHSQPVIRAADITSAIAGTTLESSDLADQLDPVRLVPEALSLEEMSKLWSVMLQTTYVLSLAYRAGVVLLDKPVSLPAPLPVAATNIVGFPIRGPVITRVLVENAAGDAVDGPILAGATLVLQGRELAGDATFVRFGDEEIAAASASASEVRVVLPASLRAGARTAQVVLRSADGRVVLGESAAAVFALRPTATFAAATGAVELSALSPPVGVTQRAVVLLTEVTPDVRPADWTARSYTFTAPPRAPLSDETGFDVAASGVAAGTYFARLQVDGAESVLERDASGAYTGPTVTFP